MILVTKKVQNHLVSLIHITDQQFVLEITGSLALNIGTLYVSMKK